MNDPDLRRPEFLRESLDAREIANTLAAVLMDFEELSKSKEGPLCVVEIDIDVGKVESRIALVVDDRDILIFDQPIPNKYGAMRVRNEMPKALDPLAQIRL